MPSRCIVDRITEVLDDGRQRRACHRRPATVRGEVARPAMPFAVVLHDEHAAIVKPDALAGLKRHAVEGSYGYDEASVATT